MKLDDLKAEMAMRGLKFSNKTKDEIIVRLEKSDKYNMKIEDPLLDFVGPAMKLPESDKPGPMQFYCDHFNAVDRVNKYFYQLQYPFKSSSFRPIVVWALLNCLFINCWSLYNEKQGEVEVLLPAAARLYVDYVLQSE